MRRFVFRLAGHLGKHVSEVEAYDLCHLQEWYAFSKIEPVGWDGWIWGRILQTVVNATRGKGVPWQELGDVLPMLSTEQTPAEMMAALMGAAPKR